MLDALVLVFFCFGVGGQSYSNVLASTVHQRRPKIRTDLSGNVHSTGRLV